MARRRSDKGKSRAKSPQPREHGTLKGHRQHKTYGETPCEPCREARNSYQRNWRREQVRPEMEEGESSWSKKLRQLDTYLLFAILEAGTTNHEDDWAFVRQLELGRRNFLRQAGKPTHRKGMR